MAERAVVVGVARQGGEDLFAIYDPSALGPQRCCSKGLFARCRVAPFREWLRVNLPLLKDARVVHSAHLGMGFFQVRIIVQRIQQRPGPQARTYMHIEGQRSGPAIATDLGGGQHIGFEIRPMPAVFLGDRDAQKAVFREILKILGWENGVLIIAHRAVVHFVLAHLPRQCRQFDLLIRQLPGLWVKYWRVAASGDLFVFHLSLR